MIHGFAAHSGAVRASPTQGAASRMLSSTRDCPSDFDNYLQDKSFPDTHFSLFSQRNARHAGTCTKPPPNCAEIAISRILAVWTRVLFTRCPRLLVHSGAPRRNTRSIEEVFAHLVLP
jgi:hypothetical protein